MDAEYRTLIAETIDKRAKEYADLSDEIWGYAEPRFQEYESSRAQQEFFKSRGFSVKAGLAGEETAFIAEYGSGKPVIAFLGEFDALSSLQQEADCTERRPIPGKENGHGCGHHLLGTGAIGAALLYRDYLKENGTKVYIRDNIIYLSLSDMRNFFDKYIYVDEKYGKVISTYNSNIVTLDINNGQMHLNDGNVSTVQTPLKVDDVLYIPFSQMEEAYDATCTYISETDTVIIDTEDRDKTFATLAKDTNLKSRTRNLSRTIAKLEENEEVMIVEQDDDWSEVRTSKGKIGYINNSAIGSKSEVKSTKTEEDKSDEKINMFWDYFYAEESIPDRTGQSFEGVNVVSPSFFILDSNGEIRTNIGYRGEAYINWVHSNGYEVWAMFSNDSLQQLTSNIINDYEARENLILDIVELAKQYGLDGINIDFENMYREDEDIFSRFIIELEPRLRAVGKTLSVDVTAPDGADSWSMCYDRNVIGDVADYIVFMAYDQYGEASTEPGTTSGYEWVKVNLDKFVETEEIESEKIILGLPFYTRVWTTQNGELVRTDVVAMKNVDANIPTGVEKVWDEVTRQNYIKYDSNGYTREMWIEDIESYKEKLLLINEYGLGGVANWCKDMEPEEIWSVINANL